MKIEIIEHALERFKQVLDSMECECDEYQSYYCTMHSDKIIVEQALKECKGKMDSNIKFEHVKSDDHYIILNKKNDVLGQIGFHKKWNRWVFYPSAVSIGDEWFDIDCLKMIVKKLDTLQRWDEIKHKGKSNEKMS